MELIRTIAKILLIIYGLFLGICLGIANQHISACCLGKRKKSHGYKWRYVNE